MSESRCSVGLLSWNAGEDGRACVRSLLAQDEPIEILWTDNGSTDGTVGRLRAEFPELPAPVVNERNLGFCAGHNAMLARCPTRYYLALNQDVVLAPDYVRRVCDCLDEEPGLALASGLILRGRGEPGESIIYSAGLVWPRARFPFELGMGREATPAERGRRRVPGVTGAAMILRVEACRAVALAPGEILPEDFFAYHEELDLALRLARAEQGCGVEGAAVAWHVGQGSGGIRQRPIRARYFANHWLLALRHEGWGKLARELPWLIRGELRHWLPRYLHSPLAAVAGAADALRRAPAARRAYRELERRHGPSRDRIARFQRWSAELLRGR